MRYVKWTLWLLAATLIVATLHYNLPQHDIVRIVNTENRRVDFGENAFFWASPDVGSATAETRDVFFIQTVRPNGRPIVYRNEDTAWGWPPYFKIGSHNLQARASNLTSTAADPVWVAMRHYGWRNEFLTIFPNAISLREVEGPEVRIFPWLSLTILATLALIGLMLRQMLRRFRRRTIDPVLDEMGDRADRARDRAREAKGGFRAWLDTWRGKPRR
ncbi:MAG: DUF1523 family protein [Gemmobacter sp.]